MSCIFNGLAIGGYCFHADGKFSAHALYHCHFLNSIRLLMKRSVLLSLVALVVLTAILAGVYLAQPHPLTQRVKDLESELSRARDEIARLKADNERLRGMKRAEHQPAVAANSAAAKPADNMGVVLLSRTTRQMAETPELREARFKFQEGNIETDYGRLVKNWGLNAEEMDFFKRLIFERKTRRHDIQLNSGQSGLTGTAQKVAVDKELAAAAKESDAAMERFLNNKEDYQAFQQWEATASDRMLMQFVVTTFDSAGETLSGEQRDQLYEVRLSHRVTPEQSSRIRAAFKTQAAVNEEYKKLWLANDQSIRQQAAKFLSPAQLAILVKMQEKQRAFSEASRQASVPKAAGP
jgi:hypothetical protein